MFSNKFYEFSENIMSKIYSPQIDLEKKQINELTFHFINEEESQQ